MRDVANPESLCGPPKVKRKTLDLNQKMMDVEILIQL